MKDVVGKLTDLLNEVHEIANSNYLCIDVDYGFEKSVHVPNAKIFFGWFKTFDIDEKNGLDNPYEASIEIDGVRFFSMLNQEEYEEFVLKSKERVG